MQTHTHPGLPSNDVAAAQASASEHGVIALQDGAQVPYRPIDPADLTALQRFHRQLSDQTVYFRFFGPMPELSAARARYFTHLDTPDRFALVALDPAQPDEIIAVVRFDREPGTDRAEYAAVVADRWQGRGLGLVLTRRLITAARARGIYSFYAIVLPENKRMLNLLRDLGLPERVEFSDGVEQIEVAIADAIHSPDGVSHRELRLDRRHRSTQGDDPVVNGDPNVDATSCRRQGVGHGIAHGLHPNH